MCLAQCPNLKVYSIGYTLRGDSKFLQVLGRDLKEAFGRIKGFHKRGDKEVKMTAYGKDIGPPFHYSDCVESKKEDVEYYAKIAGYIT